jgi:hypothetical protein
LHGSAFIPASWLYGYGAALAEGSAFAFEMVYVAVAIALGESPLATAIDLIVWVEDTVIAPVYLADAVVGLAPLVV